MRALWCLLPSPFPALVFEVVPFGFLLNPNPCSELVGQTTCPGVAQTTLAWLRPPGKGALAASAPAFLVPCGPGLPSGMAEQAQEDSGAPASVPSGSLSILHGPAMVWPPPTWPNPPPPSGCSQTPLHSSTCPSLGLLWGLNEWI